MGLKKIKKVKRNYFKLRSRSFCRDVTCSIYKQLMKNDCFRKIEIIVMCLRSYLWKGSWVPGYRVSCSSHENQATRKGIKTKEKKLLTFLTLWVPSLMSHLHTNLGYRVLDLGSRVLPLIRVLDHKSHFLDTLLFYMVEKVKTRI